MSVVSESPISTLPSEIVHHILTFLPFTDLLTLGLVSHAFLEHSRQDTIWQTFVQDRVPGHVVPKLAGLSWRDLFKLHHPYWYIPANKIWFSDNPHTGKLIVARYDHRINAIEGYALVAERRQHVFKIWDWNPDVIVHTFDPRIKLDLNAPVVRLDARGYECAIGGYGHRLQKEIPQNLRDELPHTGSGLHSQLMLTKPWPSNLISRSTPIWPPLTLPGAVRTLRESPKHFRDLAHRPSKLSEMSSANFRLRRWMEFSSRPFGNSMRAGEDVTTWGTLPEECYTPTPQKPWQGIWCGDYAGHGCEFLVIMQPDDPQPLPERAQAVIQIREREGSVSSGGSWSTAPTSQADSDDVQSEGEYIFEGEEDDDDMEESVATLQATSAPSPVPTPTPDNQGVYGDDTVYRGRIEAVKLTGDPNIPRGEYTFIAPDIGPDGLIRIAEEELFKGARIVKSVGHIAQRGFVEGEFCSNMTLLI